jgi:hypothetical protein
LNGGERGEGRRRHRRADPEALQARREECGWPGGWGVGGRAERGVPTGGELERDPLGADHVEPWLGQLSPGGPHRTIPRRLASARIDDPVGGPLGWYPPPACAACAS